MVNLKLRLMILFALKIKIIYQMNRYRNSSYSEIVDKNLLKLARGY